MKVLGFSLLSAIALASPVVAQKYDCEITNQGGGGFVGTRMIVWINPADQSATAIDAAIHQVHKKPIPVDARQGSNPDRWTLRWRVKGVQVANEGTGTLSYTVRLNTKTGRMSLSGLLAGFDNVISGAGRCRKAN